MKHKGKTLTKNNSIIINDEGSLNIDGTGNLESNDESNLKVLCDLFVDWLNTSTIFRFVEYFSCFVRGSRFVFSKSLKN